MSIACSHTDLWLRHTLSAWLRPTPTCLSGPNRAVSTASAINRGLRAEQYRSREDGERDRDGREDTYDPNIGRPWRGLVRHHRTRVPVRHVEGGGEVKKVPTDRVIRASEQDNPLNADGDPLGGANNPLSRSKGESERRIRVRKFEARNEMPTRADRKLARVGAGDTSDSRKRDYNTLGSDDNQELAEADTDLASNSRKRDYNYHGRKIRDDSDIKDPHTAALKIHYLVKTSRDIVSKRHGKHQSKVLFLKRQKLESLLAFVTAKMQSRQWSTKDTRQALVEVLGSLSRKEGSGTRVWGNMRLADNATLRPDHSVILWSPGKGGAKASVSLVVGREIEGQKGDEIISMGIAGVETVEDGLEAEMAGLASGASPRNNGSGKLSPFRPPEKSMRLAKKDKSDEDEDRDIPLTLQHTVAASTFLYGSNTVLAALAARRRKLYHLYLHPRSLSSEKNAGQIDKLAEEARIPITRDTNIALMDKMSQNHPHNGVVLEASHIPVPPVLGLGRPDKRLSVIPLSLDRQSVEEIAVNGAPATLPSLTNSWRHPFVLLLDGITNEGNIGNIIRTAHFYGVDAVAIATNTCAPVTSGLVAKASSGAVEAVQLLALPSPSGFVFNCAKERWKVYGAMPPPPDSAMSLGKSSSSTLAFKDAKKYVAASSVASNSPLAKHPCILMLGAEGEGLRENLAKRADHFVSIAQGERGMSIPGVGVDSVNVGVAAGVLIESFMRKPHGEMSPKVDSDLGF